MAFDSGVTINASAYTSNNWKNGANLIVGTTNILTAINNLQNSSSANLTNYYNKTESDNRYYTKSEITTLMSSVDTSSYI